MDAHRWDQRRFAELRASRHSPASRRAYEAMFSLLSGHDLKRASEWDLFARFCEAGRIEVDPAEIEMLDPPWPDLKVDVLGHYRYFELGEIVQEDWVKALARSEKKPIFHSPLPLITVWSPLASMIQKKAMKRYVPEATPLSLLLYLVPERSQMDRDQVSGQRTGARDSFSFPEQRVRPHVGLYGKRESHLVLDVEENDSACKMRAQGARIPLRPNPWRSEIIPQPTAAICGALSPFPNSAWITHHPETIDLRLASGDDAPQ
jgi:hypothetical protein